MMRRVCDAEGCETRGEVVDVEYPVEQYPDLDVDGFPVHCPSCGELMQVENQGDE